MTKNTFTSKQRVSPEDLRWRCKESDIGYQSTKDIVDTMQIVGQDFAMEALQFGLESDAPGQNIYVKGLNGTGRMTIVRSTLESLDVEHEKSNDFAYVHNFTRPDRPRLLSLPAGKSRLFKKLLNEFAFSIKNDLASALDNDLVNQELEGLQDKLKNDVAQVSSPLEQELKENGLALVPVRTGNVTQPAIFPLVDGSPVSPQQFLQLVAQGKISKKRKAQVEELYPNYESQLIEVSKQLNECYRKASEKAQAVKANAALQILNVLTAPIKEEFPEQNVGKFLDEAIQDVLDNYIDPSRAELPDPFVRYGVNILICQGKRKKVNFVQENSPSFTNLLGTVEPHWEKNGAAYVDYRGIKAGAILRANGGYLLLHVKDLLQEPGAWRALIRTLSTSTLEIMPVDVAGMANVPMMKPDAIPISVRVILIGDHNAYYQLSQLDPDFSDLFKVTVEIESEIDRNVDSIRQYASVIAKIARSERLLDFNAGAIAQLTEHGARIASRANKLTTCFGRIADLVRESSYLAKKEGQGQVTREQVREAVIRTKRRGNLASRKFQDLIKNGTIKIATTGEVVGQINGLAIMASGPITYGFPARITASMGPGRAGLINIEGQADMSGSIHTKGFHILSGLIRYLLQPEHPLTFSASIAFEQSYGGIDGDSASGAETCCLLSALTGVPINQNYAMTGAIDQHGRMQSIGGVNEKIEGFFDVCNMAGLSEDHGVIIPTSNVGDLMLREDVVDAVKAGRFNVYGVSHITEALELLTGLPAGERVNGQFPKGSLLEIAVVNAQEYWEKTLSVPKIN